MQNTTSAICTAALGRPEAQPELSALMECGDHSLANMMGPSRGILSERDSLLALAHVKAYNPSYGVTRQTYLEGMHTERGCKRGRRS